MNLPSSPIPDLTHDYQRVIASFQAISKIRSKLQQAYILSMVAAYHGIPRAEFKRLYQLWQAENTLESSEGGGQCN